MTFQNLSATQRWTTAQRYYLLRVQTNLFGEWELLKVWGGRGRRMGRHQAVPAVDQVHALRLLAKEAQRRGRRGYRLAG